MDHSAAVNPTTLPQNSKDSPMNITNADNPFFTLPEQFLAELRERPVRDGLQPAAN